MEFIQNKNTEKTKQNLSLKNDGFSLFAAKFFFCFAENRLRQML